MHVAAVVFDLYGTVLAIEGMDGYVAAAGIPDAAGFVRDWRRKQIEYSWLASMAGAYRDFDEITALALEQTLAQHDVALGVLERARLAQDIRAMPPHADALAALRAVKQTGIPLAILTNGTPSSARAAIDAAELKDIFDDVLSVESVRAYKPDPAVYTLATARFACTPREIVFVSSNAWDAWGASRFGFRVAWCNRAGNAPETMPPAPEFTLRSLGDLSNVLSVALR
jgi:2-haloacid dehalogenase